uniref:Methyltransferase FkbM domain-containing protein n=1 Tax=viral metagenome TaxID=1070528 RepID=A0A6C0IU08_9ZZZZ
MNNIYSYLTPYGIISLYKNETYITPEFEKGNYWHEDTLLMLKKYIDPNKNILEIGAHCGTSTIVYASFLNKGKIYAYEPQKKIFELLQYNVSINNLNDKIHIFNKGCFCYEGNGIMNDIDLDGGGGNIQKRYDDENNMVCNFGGVFLGKNGEQINLVTIDSMKIDNIGFIHCHAQGSESFIFSKGINLITKYKPFILFSNNRRQNTYLYKEVCLNYLNYYEESNFDLVDFCINNLGYSIIYNFNNSIDDLLIPPQDNFDKIIHITYKNIEKLSIIKQEWNKLNPEYNIKLYDDDLCKKFLLEYYGKLYCDIFEYIKDGPIKSDFFRVCILYIYGGIYVDADIKPLVPLNTYLEEDLELSTCISYNYHISRPIWAYNPHFIVSKKFNSNIYSIINSYVEIFNKKEEYSYWKWSICCFFNNISIDFNYVPNDKNIFIFNNKKYQFLTENVVSDNTKKILNFSNYLEYKDINFVDVFCSYNNVNVFKNFDNKKNL